ncbi:MAG: esterase [Actinobacteria bacterium]|nr:esterase [Actinomycetota bacterium]
MGLKPEITAYLAEREAMGLPQVWQAPLAEIRENTKLHIALNQPLTQIYSVEHRSINGPSSNLPIRIYRPSEENNLPALVFFHGGGWVLNFLDIYEPALRKIAKNGNFVIIAVEYQKAPEHLAAIGVGGDSAGGNLASSVALKACSEQLISLAFQLLIYPCNDYQMNYPSATNYSQGYGLTTQAMKWFWDQYLSKVEDREDPYAVPVKANSLRGVAPAILIAAEFDPLTDDVKNYYQKLIKDSVPAIYKEFAGQIHGFFNLSGVTEDAESLYSEIAKEINAVLGRHK